MSHSKFLQLPGEIREAIYHEVLCSVNNKHDIGDQRKKYVFDLNLFLTCQQVYFEARTVFRRDNTFVMIETPWPEAQQHVAIDGYVPLLITGDKAQKFEMHHLKVTIDTPEFANLSPPTQRFIILVDDLPLFTEMWYYSDLTHPGLNTQLRLTLALQDPYQLSFEKKPIPKALQRKLIEPFGRQKGLYATRIKGEHYDSIEKSLRETMATPYPSVENCLEEATRLKDAGNVALKNKQYHEALNLYRESFLHLMIVCDGRRRSVWGDAYFQVHCKGGHFNGQVAQMVRVVLRIRLVSNTTLAYLKLEDYEEAKFWAMRTINLMGGGFGEDDVVTGFPAAPEMGKIYYRGAIACRELGQNLEARKLLLIAVKYLPNDPIVKRDLDLLTN
jgi:hypothetical protein